MASKRSKQTSKDKPKRQSRTHKKRISLDRGAGSLKCDYVSPLPDKCVGLEIRKSNRWGFSDSSETLEYKFPYIDRVGKFTGISIGKFQCTKSQFISTVVATIARRLRIFASRYQRNNILVKYQRLIVQSAYYYAVSKNSWFIDRFLFLVKDFPSNWKKIQTMLIRFVSKMDDYNRFVYSQVSLQTNWLLFRGLRPRDKSTVKLRLSKDWRARDSLSTFFLKGNDWLRVRAFSHVAFDTSESAGPLYRNTFDMSLKPKSIVFTRPIGRKLRGGY